MEIQILTQDLIARLVQADNAATLARLKGVQEIPGNPLGVEVRQFGSALATMMHRHPEHWWNRVRGLTPGDENFLDDILAWYREFGLQPTFDIIPPQSFEALLHALAERGFFQSGFMTLLYGSSRETQPSSDGIVVREQDNLELFVDLAAETHFIPQGDETFWKRVARAEFSNSRCYIAFVDGEPAAHAVMNVVGSAAVFGFGATLEKYRGRGCQTALLRARIRDAAQAGCDLLVVSTSPGSASQRNVERAGLRVAYTKAIWTTL